MVVSGRVFFDLRRDGVKNKRLFLNFFGLSPSSPTVEREGAISNLLPEGVSPSATDGRVVITVDNGLASVAIAVAIAVVEATSGGDWLWEESDG